MKTYSELSKLRTFKERFEYLQLNGVVGEDTFGFDRWMNQQFYHSKEWLDIKRQVLIRDEGRDLGLPGYEIPGRVLVHHMNPISKEDIIKRSAILLDPEYLICVSKRTHDAIHYGDDRILRPTFVERRPNDTCPWRNSK